ncbi:U-box domain-containing protein 17 [Platanthera zijinensis]|uniref:U-box domain-containing protein n=1 Tax=Platanthera zijinensis TaxID=2320716 RepID=A0AAP0BRG4_9ASPA
MRNTNSSFWVNREPSISILKDFCCPILLDLMKDPVITSSGQTYDRASITRWIKEVHCTYPNLGQMLSHTQFMPNRALRNLIALCIEHETSSNVGFARRSNVHPPPLAHVLAALVTATTDHIRSLLPTGTLPGGFPSFC